MRALGNSNCGCAKTFEAFFDIAEEQASVFNRLLELLAGRRIAGRQVHDTNMVATMREYGIRRPPTFNAVDFGRLARIIDNTDPDEIIAARNLGNAAKTRPGCELPHTPLPFRHYAGR